MDLRNLNDVCFHDPFHTPFTYEVLENVGGREAYSFIYGFSGYHQMKIAEQDRHKTTFAIEWGSFAYTVMPFGLKNAPPVFSRIVVVAFRDFIHKFLEVYLDDWTILSLLKKHVQKLWLMLDKCCQLHISLNLKKCIFCTPFVVLLGNIIYKHGLLVDPAKIVIIVNLPTPTSVKELHAVLGRIGYYKKFIMGYAGSTVPFEKLLKK